MSAPEGFTVFPVHVTEPTTGLVHGLMDDYTICGKPCGDWPVIMGDTWDCPACQAKFDAAWAAQDDEL